MRTVTDGNAGDGPTTAADRRLLYFADPMCSWCWGFAPVIARIVADYSSKVSMRLVVGGLRTGTTAAMDTRAKSTIRTHWEHVAAATGQPFDFTFFDRDGFVYDTGPACRAAVTMRNLIPDLTFPYFAAMQRAFYTDGRDVTDPATLADLAAPFCADAGLFTAVYAAEEIAQATEADFSLTQALGVSGFPTIVLNDKSGLTALTIGYRPFADLAPALEAWLAE